MMKSSTAMRYFSKNTPLLLLAVFSLIVWCILRLLLTAEVGFGQFSLAEFFGIFAVGTWFDIVTLCYLLAPWLLISALLPHTWRQQEWLLKVRWGVMFVWMFLLVFGAVAEYIFWQEFSTRFNFIAVDYLVYTHEVIGNIRESYPVPYILMAIAAFVLFILLTLNKQLGLNQKWLPNPSSGALKTKVIMLAIALALPVMSYQFANVDQMQFSKNSYANQLAGNGVFSFSAAARRNELDYNAFYKTIPNSQAKATLESMGVSRVAAHLVQPSQHVADLGPFKRKPKNVVLVMVESLSADYLGIYGNQHDLTPNLDRLAQESWVFDRAYATGTRTVRGLDALSVAIPPIPGQAVVHRPDSDHLATLGEFLEAQKFKTFFIYGGYGVFDSMNAYFKGNDYQVIDRTDFDKRTIQAENVWGVDDESLFNNALNLIDANHQQGQPFFAHIMTTSNHRPFTFPDGKIDLPQGHREGAVKYTDYAIGQLIASAKTKPWFKDTLFVIVADHCASAAGKTKLPVDKYHIPVMFYAPDLLVPGHDKRLISQIDLAPTLLDVLGAKGSQLFFGQSIFEAERKHLPERAFISNYQELGYYRDDTLIVLSPKRKVQAYRVDPVSQESTPSVPKPNILKEAIAYYQIAALAYKHGDLKEFRNPY